MTPIEQIYFIALVAITAPLWGYILYLLALFLYGILVVPWIRLFCGLTGKPLPSYVTEHPDD